MRPLKPAPAPRTRYPRLSAAWALLAGAVPGLAFADATLPGAGSAPMTTATAQQPAPAAKIAPCPRKTGGKPISPKGPKKPEPRIMGDLARASAPLPPRFALADRGSARLVVHPHGPDEPCHEIPSEDA